MKTERNAMQDLSRDLFLDKRIDAASSSYNAEMPRSRMSRRNFVKYGAATAGALSLSYVSSKLPSVYALDSLTIPTLSSNPTIDELKSDYSIQKQMLKLDGRKSSDSPVEAEFGIGVDERNTNFILDYTTLTIEPSAPSYTFVNIAVDKTHAAGAKPNKDTFWVYYGASFNPLKKDQPDIGIGNDVGTFDVYGRLPPGFLWDVMFGKSYFEPNKNHVSFVAQIPNYYIAPTVTDGPFGIYLVIGAKDDTTSEVLYPSYPADGTTSIPSSYATFRTQIPIDIFPPRAILPTTAASVFATLIALRKNRMDKLKK